MSEARGGWDERDEAPPFGRSWTPLYVIVVMSLAFWIAVFAVFTRGFQ